MSVLGTADASAQPPVDNSGAGAPPPAEVPAWLQGVDPALVNEPSVKNFSNMNDLVKSFVHAQKMIGADKVIIPTKGADEKVWNDVFKKLGLPDSMDKYGVERNKDSKLDESSFNRIKENLYKQGVLPHQAKGIISALEAESAGFEQALLDQKKAAVEAGINSLKQEWGQAFDSEVKKAVTAVETIGGPEFKQYLNESGLGDDPQLIKVFAKFGSLLGEKGLKGESAGVSTPAQLQQRLDTYIKDVNSPYYDRSNPSHTAAVQEVEKIYKSLFPAS